MLKTSFTISLITSKSLSNIVNKIVIDGDNDDKAEIKSLSTSFAYLKRPA